MTHLIPELEVVALTEDLPAYALKSGDIATVVDAHEDEYTVEVEPHQIRRIDRARETLTSRRIEA